MNCRPHCGACCIAMSISSPIPGMPNGKPAGVPCVQLSLHNGVCKLYGKEERPRVCVSFPATLDVCGNDRDEALVLINRLEELTAV